MRRYFGTDGIRGVAGGPLVNTDFAARLGVAVGAYLKALLVAKCLSDKMVVERGRTGCSSIWLSN